MYANFELYSSPKSRDIPVYTNLAEYPLEGLKFTPIDNHFGYSNVRALHTYIKNITLIDLKSVYKNGNIIWLKLPLLFSGGNPMIPHGLLTRWLGNFVEKLSATYTSICSDIINGDEGKYCALKTHRSLPI